MKKIKKLAAKIGADKLIETWRNESQDNKSLYASITNEIHSQIGELKKKGIKPSLIRLAPRASFCFVKEHWGNPFTPSTYPEKYLNMSIIYNESISGVVVE